MHGCSRAKAEFFRGDSQSEPECQGSGETRGTSIQPVVENMETPLGPPDLKRSLPQILFGKQAVPSFWRLVFSVWRGHHGNRHFQDSQDICGM